MSKLRLDLLTTMSSTGISKNFKSLITRLQPDLSLSLSKSETPDFLLLVKIL